MCYLSHIHCMHAVCVVCCYNYQISENCRVVSLINSVKLVWMLY